MSQTLYDVLGVKPSATAAQIKAAHRALARKLHPDVNAATDATSRFAAVQAAYETLSDTAKRRDYDRALAAADAPPLTPEDLDPHYDFSSIASPRAASARPKKGSRDAADPTGFDELYDAFFAPRQKRP